MTISSKKMVFIAMYTAIICVTGFIAIPVGPIPIVLQNVLALMAAGLLGLVHGIISVALFLLLGALGLPVFSGGNGGLAVLQGPTGGFLWGYLLGTIVLGLIVAKPKIDEKSFAWKNILRMVVASIVGMIVLYIPGIIHFMVLTESSFAKTMAVCVTPFILFDFIKLCIIIPLVLKLRPSLGRFIEK